MQDAIESLEIAAAASARADLAYERRRLGGYYNSELLDAKERKNKRLEEVRGDALATCK